MLAISPSGNDCCNGLLSVSGTNARSAATATDSASGSIPAGACAAACRSCQVLGSVGKGSLAGMPKPSTFRRAPHKAPASPSNHW